MHLDGAVDFSMVLTNGAPVPMLHCCTGVLCLLKWLVIWFLVGVPWQAAMLVW